MTGILSTTIGSLPKPDSVPVRDWFQKQYSITFDAFYLRNRDLATRFALATQASVTAQVNAGIDVPTYGEMRREHYIFYHLRHLVGIDFENLQVGEIRTGLGSGRCQRSLTPSFQRQLPALRFSDSAVQFEATRQDHRSRARDHRRHGR